MTTTPSPSNRPHALEERYRLYIDESGDHVYKRLDEASHRYLCLLGCWFKYAQYREFHRKLEELKQRNLPHNPDDPVILHRADLINRRGPFRVLQDKDKANKFDNELFELIHEVEFRIVAVVIDKKALTDKYNTLAHPYNLAMGFMLQRYCGYLNHVNRCGDVLAESRGGREDRLLEDSYERIYHRGIWMTKSTFFQEALTTCKIKIKSKSANIAGLQLADVLGHPVRQSILLEQGRISGQLGAFAQELLKWADSKFNRQLYDGRIEGYGKVLFPK